MKRYLLLIAAFCFAACGKWLDEPRPMGQTDQRDLYNTEQGFRNVLTGAYLDIASNRLYGQDMSIVYPELFSRQWGAAANTAAAAARNWHYEYPDLKSGLGASYTEYYNVIVNLNSLLGNIDDKHQLFTTDNFNLVKGEALGLRGFLHFDILRVWGPVPTDAGVMEKISVPCVTEVTRQISKLSRRPYKEVLAQIEADLLAADKLLVNDPITRYTKEELSTPSAERTMQLGDDYYYYRHTRMNLYAVKATLARYYMWVGNYDKAKQYAKEVIDAVVKDKGAKVFNLCDNNYVQTGELSFEPEHIFSLYRKDMEELMRGIFKANGILQQTDKLLIMGMYDSSGNDIRDQTNFWESVKAENKVDYFVFKKFIRTEEETKGYVAKYIPLIRLAEMYLIGAECCARNFNKAELDEWFAPYAVARKISPSIMAGMTNEETAMSALEKEWRKELFGEGQMFFRIKRLGQTAFSFPVSETIDGTYNYVVTQPDNQIMFE